MYRNLHRGFLTPYRYFRKIEIPLILNDLTQGFNSFPSVELYEEIQAEIEKNNIDITEYKWCITFPISISYVEDGQYKFYINNKSPEEFDLEILIVAGYIYIFHKDGFMINQLLLYSKENNTELINETNDTIDKYGTDLKLNLKHNVFSNYGVELKGNYISLTKGENLIDWVLDNVTHIDPLEFLENIQMKNIYIYNKNTGFSDDNSLYKMSPLNIENVSTDNDDVIILLYQNDIDNFVIDPVMKYYLYYDILSKYFSDNDMRKFLLKNWLPDTVFNTKEYDSDKELLLETKSFDWDIYQELFKYRNTFNYIFTKDNIEFKDKGDLLTDPVEDPFNPYDNNFITLTFSNPKNLLPEIFYNGVRYNDYKLVEKFDDLTIISIKTSVFLDYYNILRKDIDNIYVVLHPRTYREYHYHNIFDGYNGVVPIGRAYYRLNHIIPFEEGYRILEDDYLFNSLPPYNLVCAFPRRKSSNHHLVFTGLEDHFPICDKTYKVKHNNLSNTEIKDITNPNKYIYKSYFYTDYIDERFNIYIGPRILHRGIDYIILSNQCIKFLKDLHDYEENKDSDYIRIRIRSEFISDYEEFKYLSKKNSYRNNLYLNKDFIKLLQDKYGNDIKVKYSLPRYDDEIHEYHMYITKYFSTEAIITGEFDAYGDKWADNIEREFPQFVREDNGEKIYEYDKEFSSQDINDYPRVFTLPEEHPLNILIGEDIMAKRKFLHENKNLIDSKIVNEWNNTFFSKEQYRKGIDMNFIKQDVRYLDTVPFDAIYDGNE